MTAFDRLRPAADRHDGAGGQRRHRQDVHHRRARRPATSPRASPSCRELMLVDLQPRRHPGAARAGARAAVSRDRRAELARPGQRATRSCGTCSPTRPSEVGARRRRRLARALSDFDAATIATTHSFCSADARRPRHGRRRRARRDVGRGRRRPGPRGRRRPLPAHVRRRPAPTRPSLTPSDARTVGRAAVGDRPGAARAGRRRPATAAGQRVGLARAAPARGRAAQAAAGLLDYDDLLVLLRDALADPDRGRGRVPRGCAPATRSCWSTSSRTPTRCSGRSCGAPSTARRRWCSSATRSRRSTPSAAPTSLTYLAAVEQADRTTTLGHQLAQRRPLLARWTTSTAARRSATSGSSSGTVDAAQPASRLPGAAPLRLRRARAGPPPGRSAGRLPAGRRRCATAVADRRRRRHRRLLDSGAPLTVDGERRPVRPGDIAVLVRTNAQAPLVRRRARRGRGAGGARRQHQRLRHPERPRLAVAAAGAGAAAPGRPGAARGADPAPRLDAPTGSTPPATRCSTSSAGCCARRPARFEEAGLAAAFELLSAPDRLREPAARRGRRGAAAHRPAAHRAGAAPRRRSRSRSG